MAEKKDIAGILLQLNQVLARLTDDQRQQLDGVFIDRHETETSPPPVAPPQSQVLRKQKPTKPSKQDIVVDDTPPSVALSEEQHDPNYVPVKKQNAAQNEAVLGFKPMTLAEGVSNPSQVSQKPEPVTTDTDDSDQEGESIAVACFYAASAAPLLDTFFLNLIDVLKKTTRREYHIQRSVVEEIAEPVLDTAPFIQRAQAQGADAVFFITAYSFELPVSKLYCAHLGIDQVAKRFLYVDYAVELMLHKRK